MNGRPPYRVLIVEDHQVVAEGLAVLLNEHPELRVVALASTVGEVEHLADVERVDVILADYWLPDGTGAEAAAVLRAHQPEVAIVFLSADDSDQVILAALEAGAAGYLVKSAGGADVAEAVRRAVDGEILVPARQLAKLLARRREESRRVEEHARRLDSLTPRERQILSLMTEGMDNRDIARELSISYTTVRSHVRHLLNKMGARSKLEAVVRAAEWDSPAIGA
ncbi:response regulator transcription factor [Dactylosporangium fulvum]|uniref:Response regulator transcription factor n=1 Tax=Dactylosporangium fulvum TaxID=53359 RepID=A0ABY5VU10_9ACTN|nr:response regulator transcription factor [Dactylosporangium fulvum]UWP80730.1 response regulator transcription factor [Dactylosporangium fulvum]